MSMLFSRTLCIELQKVGRSPSYHVLMVNRRLKGYPALQGQSEEQGEG